MNSLKNKPLVSVLLCAFNAEDFIESTVRSILNQTYEYLEVLVLNNASSDSTTQLINKLSHADKRLILIASSENIGPYAGLNMLLEKAKGTYIAINDHDDIWHPEKLAKQISLLENHNEYVACGTGILNWYEKYNSFIYRKQPKIANVAWHTSLVFRNEGYRYDTSVKVATDFHFIKNILCANGRKVCNFQEPLVLRRIFKDSENLSGQWMKNETFRDILKLNINLVDKAAMLNRRILPKKLIEDIVVKLMANNTPKEYESYVKDLFSINL